MVCDEKFVLGAELRKVKIFEKMNIFIRPQRYSKNHKKKFRGVSRKIKNNNSIK